MRHLGGGEELSGAVGAGGHTGPTADAGRGVHGAVRRRLGDGDEVGVRSAPGGNRDEAASFHDAIEGAAVDHQVLDHREARGAPRLDDDGVTVGELAHVQLAGGGALLGSVGLPVDHEPAGPADAFPAVVVEGDGLLALQHQALVEQVQHLQERGVGGDLGGVGDEAARDAGAGLTPHRQGDLHL